VLCGGGVWLFLCCFVVLGVGVFGVLGGGGLGVLGGGVLQVG